MKGQHPLLCRLNNYLRSTQTAERLSALALIHIAYETEINLDTVCKLYLGKYPRRIECASLLFSVKILLIKMCVVWAFSGCGLSLVTHVTPLLKILRTPLRTLVFLTAIYFIFL